MVEKEHLEGQVPKALLHPSLLLEPLNRQGPTSPGEALEVNAPLRKHRPYCPQLWQLSLLSCSATGVFYFLILASVLTLDRPKAVPLGSCASQAVPSPLAS